MDTNAKARGRASYAAVIATDRATADKLFQLIRAGILPNLYRSVLRAHAELATWPLGLSGHYQVFSAKI